MPEQDTESLTLPIIGMTCAACQHHVESAIKDTAGWGAAHVALMANRANIVFDPQKASAEQLLAAIRGAGYDAVLPHSGVVKARESQESDALAKAIATLVGGAVAMLFSMPLGSEMGPADHFLMHVLPALYFQTTHDALRWTLLILTAVLAVWAGRGIYFAAAKALRHGGT